MNNKSFIIISVGVIVTSAAMLTMYLAFTSNRDARVIASGRAQAVVEEASMPKPLSNADTYTALPETQSSQNILVQATTPQSVASVALAGFDTGLYKVATYGALLPLWTGGEVKKILPTPQGYYLLTSKGIFFSSDLVTFEERNNGLTFKTYKLVLDTGKQFLKEVQDLKDIAVNNGDSKQLLTVTKDAVFITSDGGLNWLSLGSPSPNGIKAVSFGPYPQTGEPAVWVSHPFRGVFARKIANGGTWNSFSTGLPTESDSQKYFEESSSFVNVGNSLIASASFRADLYVRNIEDKDFKKLYSDPSQKFSTLDGLSIADDTHLRLVSDRGIQLLDLTSGNLALDVNAKKILDLALSQEKKAQLLSLAWNEQNRIQTINELWMVNFRDQKPYKQYAENHNGIYLRTGYVVQKASRDKYFDVIKEHDLNMLTVDLKDDDGYLRFRPQNPELQGMTKVLNPLDVEAFTAEAKARGIYLVARLPVFKDKVFYQYKSNKFASWDAKNNKPWQGYNNTEQKLIEEYWLDPYSETVWRYNVLIAQEIIARGFNEVQFDYIRFPTDGDNVDDLSFRYRDPGMDRESALASFLRYARENINAPISIDIYGANGWYRSGVRTGQDVELLSKYVDAICPMYYPSHFADSFLNYAPYDKRPYRIYYYGNLRTSTIARKKIVVRPYVQAFYAGWVPYDRKYYNAAYVQNEIEGVRDSLNSGFTYWNNIGRYGDIPYPAAEATSPQNKISPASTSPKQKQTPEMSSALPKKKSAPRASPVTQSEVLD